MKKVVVVGAGPAGIFAAYGLKGKADVKIIEKGKNIDERICYINEKGCTNCKPCNIISGIGGAGLFSDGKLIFDTKIGNNLSELIGEEKNSFLVKKVEKIFSLYDVCIENINNEKRKKISRLKKIAKQHDIDFAYPKQAYIGEKLFELIKRIKDDLEKSGVEFLCNNEVIEVEEKIVTKEKEIEYDIAVLAPGRSGSLWLENILKKKNISYSYRPIDVGVRIEVPAEITDEITNLTRDMKFYIQTRHWKDHVRTFCTCPNGFVIREWHEKFALVNGISCEKKSENTNFAILVTIKLTEPQGNSNEYGNYIASLFNSLGVNKPILQRLGDLRSYRRSKEKKKDEFIIKPTLEDVVFGDITLAMPKRYLDNIIETIERLNNIIPGLANDSTLIYAPEIKFHGLKIATNEYLKAEKIYFVGDGAGVSRGIVGAAASGLLAAEGIKNE